MTISWPAVEGRRPCSSDAELLDGRDSYERESEDASTAAPSFGMLQGLVTGTGDLVIWDWTIIPLLDCGGVSEKPHRDPAECGDFVIRQNNPSFTHFHSLSTYFLASTLALS